MRMDKISIQGSNEWNEDALIINDSLGVYGVLDGATSLTSFRGHEGETSGYLASQTVKAYLESLEPLSGLGSSFQLKEAVLEANAKIREHMLTYGLDVNNNEEVWAAGIAVVRVTDHNIEYAQAGDCMIFAIYKNGGVRLMTHDQVDRFDEQYRILWEEKAALGLSREQVRNEVIPAIQANRRYTNTLDGYGIMNGDPNLSLYLEYGTFNRIDLDSVLIITDGLFLPKKAGQPAPPMTDVVKHVQALGLENYARRLIADELDESQHTKFTRLKISDDKTGIWIQL